MEEGRREEGHEMAEVVAKEEELADLVASALGARRASVKNYK
jgi:hypothetical protein